MGVQISIGGDVGKLKRVGAILKDADKDVRQEMFKAVQRATKPIKQEIKQSAIDTLPKSGGLNEWVAAIGIKTTQRYVGRMPGVFIVGTLDNKRAVRRKVHVAIGPLRPGEKRTSSKKVRKSGTFGARADLRAINRGRVMHPAWGRARKSDGKLFGPQMVRAGFWDRPLKGMALYRARREIRAAMAAAVKAIEAKSNAA